MKETMTSFNDLPDELKLSVFSHLPQKDLLKISAVSNQWNQLASDNSLWKQKSLFFGKDTGQPHKLQFRSKRLLRIQEKAKLLSDVFSEHAPDYSGEYAGAYALQIQRDFRDGYASDMLEKMIFDDANINPIFIIEMAIKQFDFNHAAFHPADESQSTLLDTLAASSLSQVLELYLNHYAHTLDVNRRDKDDTTPVMIAIVNNRPANVIMLVNHGAKLNGTYDPFDEIAIPKEELSAQKDQWAWVFNLFVAKGYSSEKLFNYLPVTEHRASNMRGG